MKIKSLVPEEYSGSVAVYVSSPGGSGWYDIEGMCPALQYASAICHLEKEQLKTFMKAIKRKIERVFGQYYYFEDDTIFIIAVPGIKSKFRLADILGS